MAKTVGLTFTKTPRVKRSAKAEAPEKAPAGELDTDKEEKEEE